MLSKSQFLLGGYFSFFIIFLFSLMLAQKKTTKQSKTRQTSTTLTVFTYWNHWIVLSRLYSSNIYQNYSVFLLSYLSDASILTYKPRLFFSCFWDIPFCQYAYGFAYLFSMKYGYCYIKLTHFLCMLDFVEKEKLSRVIYYCLWRCFTLFSCASIVDLWQVNLFFG